MGEARYEDVWRREAPHVLAALSRRYGNFADCEDAVQLALVAAAEQWPRDGVPDNPAGWLLRVASRRLVDQLRSDAARRAREEKAARLDGAAAEAPAAGDDMLDLFVLCAHPALTPTSQLALMLRAVAGLTTAEIAAGLFVPESTVAQRISRAKATLKRAGARFVPAATTELPVRMLAVRHAISLLYTRAHLAADGPQATDPLLAETAVRLARTLVRRAPADPENAGLLALLLLTHARSPARLDQHGDLVPLDAQDRGQWQRALIDEGVALLERTLPHGYVGAFQLRAAIAAVHDEAPDAAGTDWPQILALYQMLDRVEPSPATALGLAVATAEVHGAAAGLDLLGQLPDTSHRTHAARGHLLARLGRTEHARAEFRRAAELTRNIPEQRYLNRLATAD
ncbi:sigma-70 family RNA polymerase sigma factor [Actinocatenispora sera]|uniref:RNA polymerase sigma24 factor n=1 Tax=Actinocatenispora sera TaxID=390989 RepID=A0A810KZZ6_9ACTN|nr:sigma-70 family RNA polymerase sigma factor [Actinocatenispora sera]BCJ28820.1 RNA polymerase sigma24 factor [Actinocatenispora sera]